LDHPEAYFAHLQGFPPNWRGWLSDWQMYPADRHQRYAMPDHGLFVAGIVRAIAPTATIRLVRVLSEYGVGDLLALAHTLRGLPEKYRREKDELLVVNLSLGVTIPSAHDALADWFPAARQDPATLSARWTDINTVLASIQASLDRVVAWLTAQERVIVVAAAGNDTRDPDRRNPPRLPARYDSVLSVGAVGRSAQPAFYSNRGDVPIMGNGVATFGGNAKPLPGTDAPAIDTSGKDVDAVVSLFSARTLPLTNEPNNSGWVYWAGTSFATPIISALAANLWAADKAQTAHEIMSAILNATAPPTDPLDPDGPLDAPTLIATQSP
jgi:subtilisin family serine protease